MWSRKIKAVIQHNLMAICAPFSLENKLRCCATEHESHESSFVLVRTKHSFRDLGGTVALYLTFVSASCNVLHDKQINCLRVVPVPRQAGLVYDRARVSEISIFRTALEKFAWPASPATSKARNKKNRPVSKTLDSITLRYKSALETRRKQNLDVCLPRIIFCCDLPRFIFSGSS